MTKLFIAKTPNPIQIRQSNFVPEGDICGQGDRSRASSNRDFRAIILYDFLGGKPYQECFLSLAICFGDKSPAKSTVTKWYREFQFG